MIVCEKCSRMLFHNCFTDFCCFELRFSFISEDLQFSLRSIGKNMLHSFFRCIHYRCFRMISLEPDSIEFTSCSTESAADTSVLINYCSAAFEASVGFCSYLEFCQRLSQVMPCLSRISVSLQLPGNAADLRRAGKFHLGQKIDEMLFSAPARQFGFDHGCLLDLITSQHELHSDPSFRGLCIRYKPLPSRVHPAHS